MDKVHKVMREYKEGRLRSGSKKGPRVKSRKQAIAIALSEQRAYEQGSRKSSRSGQKRRSKRRLR